LRRLIQSSSSQSSSSSSSSSKALIVGAGPAGLLLAHRLLSKGWQSVTIQEARPNPALQDTTKSARQWSLGLNVRGRTAIKSTGQDVWEEVKNAGLLSDQFFVVATKKLKLQIRESTPGSEPSLLLNRQVLCNALLATLEDKYGSTGRIKLVWDAPLTAESALDISTGSIDGETYDVIVGADGANSAVRRLVQANDATFDCETEILPGAVRVLHQNMPPALNRNAINLLLPTGGSKGDAEAAKDIGGLFIIPAKGGKMCALVNWKEATPPASVLEASPEAMLHGLHARFPQLENGLELEAIRAFLDGRDTRPSVVRCSKYASGRVALLGDAAHSTGGTLGQGANSALEDAAALADALIDEVEKGSDADYTDALHRYSSVREPEGSALAELVGVRKASDVRRGGVGRIAKSVGRFFLSRIRPNDPKYFSMQTRMSQTTDSFVSILEKERLD